MSLRLLGWCIFIHHSLMSSPPEIPYVVETMIVKPVPSFMVQRRYIGTLQADKFSWLAPKSAGTVANILVKPHQQVKKGDLLIELRSSTEKHSLELAEQSLSLLLKELARNRRLFETKDITTSELEKSEREVLAARHRILEQKRDLEKIEIRAPFDGVVGVPKVVLGESVDTNKNIISIMAGDFFVFINVPASKLAEIKEGQPIRIKNLSSTISAVERSIDPSTRVGFAKANFKKCDFCIVGDSVFAHVTVYDKKDALLVPKKAVYYKNGKPYVVSVVESKGVTLEVMVGEEQDGKIEILSGLKPHTEIVVANPKRISEGATVKVVK